MIIWLMQSERAFPAPTAWLSPQEQEHLATLRIAKRRHEWLLGRWTAKQLVRYLAAGKGLRCDLRDLAILAGPDGAPTLTVQDPQLRDALAGWHLTISHSQGYALCALAPTAFIGADIERVAPRHPAFVHDYFTPTECAAVATAPYGQRDVLATTIWSAKEAALKALHLGLTVDTRRIACRVMPEQPDWATLILECDPTLKAPPLCGWWRVCEGYVLTLAVGAA